MAGINRGRINCAPIVRRHGLLTGIPATLEPLAYTYEYYPAVPSGVLVRVKATGALCVWTGGGIRSVDERKAKAALDWMMKERKNGPDADK